MSQSIDDNALFPIREVSRLTGVNAITLRAWERRYGLIEPIRTESGHRLYTQENIDTLQEVVRLTQQGIPIGRVKTLLQSQRPTTTAPKNPTEFSNKLTQLAQQKDLNGLTQQIDQLLADYPETVWQNTLSEATQQLTRLTDPSADCDLIFWETALMPRLYSRLYLTLREMAQPTRSLLLGVQSHTSPVHGVISALKLVLRGYYPLLQQTPLAPDATLVARLQSLHCLGVGVVDDNHDFDCDIWHQWHQHHGSFELYFFMDQSPGSASQALLAHHYPLVPPSATA